MKEGIFFGVDRFSLRLLDRKDGQPGRFSLVVPAKIKKTSVGRHLIKRKMTAAIEKNLADVKKGIAGIIFAKKDVSASSYTSYTEIETEILELFKKAKILNGGQF